MTPVSQSFAGAAEVEEKDTEGSFLAPAARAVPSRGTSPPASALRAQLQRHLGDLQQLGARLSSLRQRVSTATDPGGFVSTSGGSCPGPLASGHADEEKRRVRPRSGEQESKLTPHEVRAEEDLICSAGMRNPARVVRAWPRLQEAMQPVREALRAARAIDQDLANLADACGLAPTRAPPSEEAIGRARAAVVEALGLPAEAGQGRHAASDIRFGMVEAVLRHTGDPDVALAEWLRDGAPMGIARQIAPGHHFPLRPSEATEVLDEDALQASYLGNHPSFSDAFGETEPPTHDLIREYSLKGFGTRYATQRDAEAVHGRTFPAPLGNVRKQRKGGVGWHHPGSEGSRH